MVGIDLVLWSDAGTGWKWCSRIGGTEEGDAGAKAGGTGVRGEAEAGDGRLNWAGLPGMLGG